MMIVVISYLFIFIIIIQKQKIILQVFFMLLYVGLKFHSMIFYDEYMCDEKAMYVYLNSIEIVKESIA